jgi:putative endonuclease
MNFFVYILYSPEFDKYYVGQTEDLERRIFRHNGGYEKFTSPYRPWNLAWSTTKR